MPCSISTFHCNLSIGLAPMACFGISSLGNLLPSWLWPKRFVVPSPDRSFTNSPCNIPEPADWGAGRVSGVLELPLPVHLAASSKSAINEDEYERWKPFSCKPIRPMTKGPARSKCPAIYSPTLGMLFIPILFILF